MVTAELSHNPYLLQTKVKFNGQEPRINCQIEKYDTLPLKDWVHLVPDIFYNEMNGFDFDLYFVGTGSDFYEVCNAFKNANISEDSVHVIYKNKLESADVKSKEVDSIIEWLKQNRNRKFDFDAFWTDYSEFFEGTYPFIM